MNIRLVVFGVVVVCVFGTAALGGPQVLEVSPRYLEFTAYEGGANPGQLVLSIWNSGHGPMDWEVAENCSWVVVEPNSGKSMGEVDNVNVIVDISGLAEGSYNCRLTISGDGAPNSPQIVDVNLFIYRPVIELSATQFEFYAYEGGAGPSDQILSVSNSGTGTMNWEIAEDCTWLFVEPNSGSSAGESNEVTLSVDIAGLKGGIYECNLTISDPQAENSPQIVSVSLIIQGPLIELSTAQLSFYAIKDAANPNEQVLTITNSGGGTLNWEIAEDCNWLCAEPNSGSSMGEADDVNLSVDITSLGAGIYDCNLTISDVNAENSPLTVKVNLDVYSDSELHVPAECPTIQAAIDLALDGATIIVAPGTHTGTGNRDIDFLGKAITVRSIDPHDPNIVASTVIDCNNEGRGFYFHNNEDSNSILDGLTIINGYAYSGGAIFFWYGSPRVSNCIISNNSSQEKAGAIYCAVSSPEIINCTISGNSAGSNGGGFYNSSDYLTLTNCSVIGNSATYAGGGIYNTGSNSVVTNCIISGNFADTQGGGIHNVYNSNPTIKSCIISGNTASRFGGGGIYNSDSSPTIIDCAISDNWANWYGGGIACESDSSPTIRNCVITGNWATNYGAGIHIFIRSHPTITNCTISGNSGEYTGAGVYSYECSPVIANSIIWYNGWAPVVLYYGSPSIRYSDVEYGKPGEGNMNVEPFFASPGYWADANDTNIPIEPNDPNAVWMDGNYRLQTHSPCIDAGDNNSVPADIADLDGDGNTAEPIPFDLDGRDRFADGDCNGTDIVDMGAYEFAWVYLGDFASGCDVDFVDFSVLGSTWLLEQGQPGYNPVCDIALPADSFIDEKDLKIFTENWLAGM